MHKYYQCKCNEQGCQFCDGGLSWCVVCVGFEGTLTTECCGRKITEDEENRIYKLKTLDYKNGKWEEILNAN